MYSSGKVDRTAIVTTVKISDFLGYIERTPIIGRILQLDKIGAFPIYSQFRRKLNNSPYSMGYQIGEAIGSLARFMHIPKDLQEQFTLEVARSWRLKGSEKSQPNDFYKSYLNGVFDEEGSFDGLVMGDVDDNLIDTDDQDEYDESADDLIEAEQPNCNHDAPRPDEQDLIDAQLQGELSWSLCPTESSNVDITSTTDDGVYSIDSDVSRRLRRPEVPDLDSLRGSRYAQPRSSSLFTFERPRIPGRATNWEANNSREVSCVPTERSALDNFTTELLAKAEECSTIGSFGRGPSTDRAFSEVAIDIDEGEEEEYEEGNGRLMDGSPGEDLIVVDLFSDDEDEDEDDDVVDLGLEITGSRAVGAQA